MEPRVVSISATFAPTAQLSLFLSAFPQSNLLQNSNKKFVYIMLDSAGRLNEFTVT
jgi:hypothetical protein